MIDAMVVCDGLFIFCCLLIIFGCLTINILLRDTIHMTVAGLLAAIENLCYTMMKHSDTN